MKKNLYYNKHSNAKEIQEIVQRTKQKEIRKTEKRRPYKPKPTFDYDLFPFRTLSFPNMSGIYDKEDDSTNETLLQLLEVIVLGQMIKNIAKHTTENLLDNQFEDEIKDNTLLYVSGVGKAYLKEKIIKEILKKDREGKQELSDEEELELTLQPIDNKNNKK